MILLLRGGRVHTAADPDATALAVTDGVISWIGSEHAVEMAGRPDQIVQLDGAMVAPGFVDAHVHTTDAGLALTGLDLSSASSLVDCLGQIGQAAHSLGPHDLVWGHGWDESRWPENRPPTRAEIDAAVGARPAYLSRIDVHSALVSTALVQLVPGAASGTIHPHLPQTRDAHHAVRNQAKSLLTPERRAAAQRAFLASAAAAGIVEVHECAAGDESGRQDLRALLDLDAPISVLGYLAAAVSDPAEALALLATTGAVALAGDLSVDGAIGSRTAALHSHALTTDRRNTGGWWHKVSHLDDEIAEHLWACAVAGVQPGFHAIGEDGVSAVARGLLRATARLGINGNVRMAGSVPRIEHAEMADAESIAAFAATGTVAAVQPLFDAAWGGPDGMYARRLGRARAQPMNPFAALASAGVALALSSDAPVTPATPWAAVQAAVHHRTPGSGLSPRAAFTAHTRGGHRAAGRTDRGVGTIAIGAPAHLAVYAAGELVRPAANPSVARWSTDPRSRVPLLPNLTPGGPLPTTLATLVDGRVVYDTGHCFR